MRRKNRTWLVVFAAGSLLLAGAFAGTLADEKQHGQHGGEVHVPESAADIWHEVGEQVELLDSTIDNGKLAEVHRIAFAIRDLANGLPDASKDLPEAKQKLLKGYLERVAGHAKLLDTYGDGGNQSKTEAEFEQLKKRLDYMRKLYPDSMFHAEEGHHGHE